MDNKNSYNTIPVLIDSNIFIENCCDFSVGSLLYKFKELIINKEYMLYLNNIVVREVKQHIEDDIKKSANRVSRVLGEEIETSKRKVRQGLTILKEKQEYADLINKIENFKKSKSTLIEDGIVIFEEYLNDTNAIILDNKQVPIESILNDYFLNKPPFENSVNKKAEFPDAIMVKRIELLIKESHVKDFRLVVISNDKGFRAAIKLLHNNHIHMYTDLKSFLHEYNRQKENFGIVESYINDKLTNLFKPYIKSLFDDQQFNANGLEHVGEGVIEGYEFDDVDIENLENIEIGLASVVDLKHDLARVTLDCRAVVTIIATIFDEAGSLWDPEDREYILRRYLKIKEKHQPKFECEISLILEEKDNIKIVDVISNLTLDSRSRVSRKILNPLNEDEIFEAYEIMMDNYENIKQKG